MADEKKPEVLSGIDELRRACNLLDGCKEDFNFHYTVEQLLQLARMYRACEWDFPPDMWRPRQVREALRGIVPQWDSNENPKYATPHEKLHPVTRPVSEPKKS